MKSRRLIASPKAQDKLAGWKWSKQRSGMSALGHKRTFSNVRRMSALPPKADIRCRDRIAVPRGFGKGYRSC